MKTDNQYSFFKTKIVTLPANNSPHSVNLEFEAASSEMFMEIEYGFTDPSCATSPGPQKLAIIRNFNLDHYNVTYTTYTELVNDQYEKQGEYRYGFMGYEKDDEVKGSGNHLSFGDYGYDPRLVRRWQIDPQTKAYPWQSPYSAFNNNPIFYVDPTGESGVAYKTDKTNKDGKPILRVVSNIYIYGEGATQGRADAIQAEVSSQYNNGGQFFTATVDGTEYEVQFEFTTKIIDGKDVDGKLVEGGYGNLNAENNFFEVRDDIETSVSLSKGVPGGNAGAFKTSQIDDASNAVSHELNHGFNGVNKDDITGNVDVNPDIAVPRGKTASPSDRKVTPENIQAIFKNVTLDKSGKGNVGNPRPFKFDKDAPGNSKQVPN